MPTKRLSDLAEVTSSADDDIFHLENNSSLDKKITKANLLKDIQDEVDLNTSGLATTNSNLDSVKGQNPNNQVGTNYSLVTADADVGGIWMNNASPNTVEIPLHSTEALPLGIYDIYMEGAGTTTISAVGGVSLNGINGGSTNIQAVYTKATLIKRADNTWVVEGNISAVV